MTKAHMAVPALMAVLFMSPRAPAQDSGFYGFVTFSEATTGYRIGPTDVVDGDDNAWQLGGGFSFSDRWSIELSYHDFGDPVGYAGCPPEVLCIAAFIPEGVETSGWSGQLVGSRPLDFGLIAFARAGVISWETSAASPSLRDSGDDLIYGAGMNWIAGERLLFQASYEKVELDITAAKLGLVYRF